MTSSDPTTDQSHVLRQAVAEREAALADPYAFIEYMGRSGHPDFAHPPALHHVIMIDAFLRLMAGEFDRLLVMAPRGSAKSTYFSVILATYYFLTNPTHKVLACSNTTELAEGFNRRRRSVIASPQFEQLTDYRLDPNNQGSGEWAVSPQDSSLSLPHGGAMRAGGVGSSIIGFRADLLILDDPIKSREESMSPTILSKHWEWYQSDARPCLKPTGKEVIVSTRWSANDIPGRIILSLIHI